MAGPAGPAVQNPTEVLGSSQFADVLQAVIDQAIADYDPAIKLGPPYANLAVRQLDTTGSTALGTPVVERRARHLQLGTHLRQSHS